MKYSKKQIKQAFLDWNTCNRLNPSKVRSDKDVCNTDVNELSKGQTEELINFINKQ
mgnify:CR=1 FL=1|jgi:hypothetical protein